MIGANSRIEGLLILRGIRQRGAAIIGYRKNIDFVWPLDGFNASGMGRIERVDLSDKVSNSDGVRGNGEV